MPEAVRDLVELARIGPPGATRASYRQEFETRLPRGRVPAVITGLQLDQRDRVRIVWEDGFSLMHTATRYFKRIDPYRVSQRFTGNAC